MGVRSKMFQDLEAVAEEGLDPEHAVLLSIAVSVKRIADALHGDDQNEGMKMALSTMAARAFNGPGPTS